MSFLEALFRPRGFFSVIFGASCSVYNILATKHDLSPFKRPQTEVVNRCLETYLRCFISQCPKEWFDWLHWGEYWFNTSFHTSLNYSRFKVVYGRDLPPLLRHGVSSAVPLSDVAVMLQTRDQVLAELRDQLLRAQNKMKQQADCHRRDVSFEVGDLVFLKLKPYRQLSLSRGSYSKLGQRFFGPFKVLSRVGTVAYKLELPPSSLHPVFHVSQLKKALGNVPANADLPPFSPDSVVALVESEMVLSYRCSTAGPEVLIKWTHLPPSMLLRG
ncbi:hypothetical protein Scep_019379 [Stephania cephalantha]|uniref:Tf2-1-like SH3-like domain-containing protein n=1 Tax=Stephania cephalantha TaxID=152367 RepID=A0AAP0IAT3_9MAGN